MVYEINGLQLSDEIVAKIVKDNKKELKEKKGRYFFPKSGNNCWFVNSRGGAERIVAVSDYRNEMIRDTGTYETSYGAQRASDRNKAVVKVWFYAQIHRLSCEPNHKYISKNRYYIYYDCRLKKMGIELIKDRIYNAELPCFKSKADAQKTINACYGDLEKVFKIT